MSVNGFQNSQNEKLRRTAIDARFSHRSGASRVSLLVCYERIQQLRLEHDDKFAKTTNFCATERGLCVAPFSLCYLFNGINLRKVVVNRQLYYRTEGMACGPVRFGVSPGRGK